MRLGIPSRPDQAYAKDGWVDWYTFLGTVRLVRKRVSLSGGGRTTQGSSKKSKITAPISLVWKRARVVT